MLSGPTNWHLFHTPVDLISHKVKHLQDGTIRLDIHSLPSSHSVKWQ